MDMIFKIMNEGNTCFQHLKRRYKTYNLIKFSLAAKPNLLSRQVFLTKKIAMAIIFHMPPWLPMYLEWLQSYCSYGAYIFSLDLTPFECLNVQHLHHLSKIC